MSRTIATLAAAALAVSGVSAQLTGGLTVPGAATGLLPYTGGYYPTAYPYYPQVPVTPPTPQFYQNSDILSQIPQFNYASGTPQFYVNSDILSQIPQFNYASPPPPVTPYYGAYPYYGGVSVNPACLINGVRIC